MLNAIQQYVYERRRGLIQSSTFLCGSYVLGSYINNRLSEVEDKMVRNTLARENLRRRFQATHDDACFTITTLIPSLASQILEGMDVEALTNKLQSISRASRSRALPATRDPQLSQSVSKLCSASDASSDADSTSLSSYSGSAFGSDPTSAASGSWVEHLSASEGPSSRSDVPARLSDSIMSASSSLSQNENSTEDSIPSTNSRTKGQLWNEVKILALTRTLTTLYTITLLSLLTAVQFNLLGRSRYISSVWASDRAERERDQLPRFSLAGILAREAIAKIVDVEAIWPAWIIGSSEDSDEDDEKLDVISEATELRFLTLSWWVLHVGWKDVAARVKESVESVFDDVSLKEKLSPAELFTLIMDVRRRVETDGTGCKLSTRFLSSLLPPTPETAAHVLAQGGALGIRREIEIPDSDRRFLAQSLSPSSDPSHLTHGDIERTLETSHDVLGQTNAIPIESPTPRYTAFPTPSSSHTYESDLGSHASQSPANSSVPNLRPAAPEGTPDPLATSRSSSNIDPQFTALLAQTRCYLSGPDFARAFSCALDRATEVLMDGLRARVFVDTTSAVNAQNEAQARLGTEDGSSSSEKRDEIKIRLAGLLPGLSRWSQLALNATPNELVDNIMAVREVNALEAIIISDYEDRFPPIS